MVESIDELGFGCEVFESVSDDAVCADNVRPFLRGKSPFVEYRCEASFAEVALDFVGVFVEIDVYEIDCVSIEVL